MDPYYLTSKTKTIIVSDTESKLLTLHLEQADGASKPLSQIDPPRVRNLLSAGMDIKEASLVEAKQEIYLQRS